MAVSDVGGGYVALDSDFVEFHTLNARLLHTGDRGQIRIVLCLAWLGLKATALAWLATASGPENLEPGRKPGFAAWLGLAQA